jgi:hypothetical protein
MKQKLNAIFKTVLLLASGVIFISATGCGSLDSENLSDRPFNEPSNFLFQGGDREDR